jgi:hypothetical protein
VFALVGSGINLDPAFRITISVALFVLSALVGVYLFRRYARGRAGADEIEDMLEAAGSESEGEAPRSGD